MIVTLKYEYYSSLSSPQSYAEMVNIRLKHHCEEHAIFLHNKALVDRLYESDLMFAEVKALLNSIYLSEVTSESEQIVIEY